MADFRYRAYLSYSHHDERWAAWLQRALESYRVPRQLVGRVTSAGSVPSRIRPIFRDRADLSSAADLDSTLKQALADSDALIVLCSPAAATSEWVGREIREFARQGRTARIFCLIVGGDADGSVEDCFPRALAEVGLRQPLAADARRWADGRRRAKLKLIAGLLGIKLDELLRRDLRRRRMRQTLVGAAGAAALALAVVAVTSQLSERREREKNEQLASFVVDLGERLKSDTDLSTLAVISAESYRHLQDLDTDRLSPQTGEKVALALRQMGRVNQGQGRPDEAFEALMQSRDLLEQLHHKFPEEDRLLFELGNAEYYIGSLQRDQLRYEEAMASMQRYYDWTRELSARDPHHPDWLMELAYSHNNLAALRLEGGARIDEWTLGHISEATRLMEQVVALRPGDQAIADNYATVLAWSADTQMRACNLDRVGELRDRVRELAEDASRSDPANNDRKRRFAYALTGVARVQKLTGRLDRATDNLEHAIAILEQLSALDPSNVIYHRNILEREVMLAGLMGETSRLDQASAKMRELAGGIEAAFEDTDGNDAGHGPYADFLLARADLEFRRGDAVSARRDLQTVQRLLDEHRNGESDGLFDWQRRADATYQWWRLTGSAELDDLPDAPGGAVTPQGYRSCSEADFMARVHVMRNRLEPAASEVGFLQSMGYAEPSFLRFCRRHGLCAE